MSALFNYQCQKCNYEQAFMLAGAFFVYGYYYNIPLWAKKSYGWCFDCNQITVVVHSQVGEELKASTAQKKQEILKIKDEAPLCYNTYQRLERLYLDIEMNDAILKYLRGRRFKPFCEKCNGFNVQLLEISKARYLIDCDKKVFSHPSCGGAIKEADEPLVLFSLKYTERFFKPVFED